MTPLIGIDASRVVFSRRTGTETCALDIIRSLCELGKYLPFRLYYPAGRDGTSLPTELLDVDHRVISGHRLWTHHCLARELRRDPQDPIARILD